MILMKWRNIGLFHDSGKCASVLLVIVLSSLVFGFSSFTGPEAYGFSPSVTVGVYPGGKSIWNYESDLRVKLNHVLQFQNVKQINYTKIVQFLDRGYDVILNVEFTDTFANLHSIREGAYDQYLISLCNSIRADGRTIWIRTLHEFNGNWYNWGVLYPGNSIEDFIPAWQHIVQVFRDQNAPVKFQLDYNRLNGKNDATPFSAFWPGDEWVDMAVITCYNRAGTDQWHPTSSWQEFKDLFTDPYNQVCALTSKPIGIAETGSTTYGGDKPQWIIDTFNSVAEDFPRVTQVTWFLLNKVVNGVTWNWDLNNSEEKDSFRRGLTVLGGDTVFADSFDDGLTEWTGTSISSGEAVLRSTIRAHDYVYSARFTSNGGKGFETAYCYRSLPNVNWVNARFCVYVVASGITRNLERMAFTVMRGNNGNVAFAGWRMDNGQLKWYLSTRDGASGYRTTFSSSSTAKPVLYRWYTIEVEWLQSPSGIGGAVLKVDNKEVCHTVSDTTAYGGVTQVRLGLAEIYNCNPSIVHIDCCTIQTH